MKLKTKHWRAICATPLVAIWITIGFWAGGMDFHKRGPELAFFTLVVVFVPFLVAAMCLDYPEDP